MIRVPWRLTSESAVVAGFDEASNHWVEKDAADRASHPKRYAYECGFWLVVS